ncbi:MAG: DUF819 family protein [Spirosomaceae bacterium]|jgi:uncharacterized membrane protein|nr:DUF819 family protein [Spirosomataceae bacterium]
MLKDSLAILAVLCLNIVLAEWLNTKPFFKHVGTGLMVIILTAIVANLGIIPASTPATPLYDGIFAYIAPLSIFLMLLGVNLKSLKKAGKPMLMMFLIGSIGTMLGALLAMWMVGGKESIGELFYALGGMYTGTYIGGSINFNAVAIHYGVSQQGSLFSAATVADNIITAVWVIATLALPQIFQKLIPRNKLIHVIDENQTESHQSESESVRPIDLAFLLAISLIGIWVSGLLHNLIPQIPTVLLLTTLALSLAQIPIINRLKGQKLLGLLGVYLFLAVIGAYCDIPALIKDGKLAVILLAFVTILVLVHGLVVFGIGYLFKQDWDIVSIASQANVGGTASAMALARSLNRNDLVLPGILVGALGNAIGTYFGILIAEIMKTSTIY